MLSKRQARTYSTITSLVLAVALAVAARADKPSGPHGGGGGNEEPVPTHALVSMGTFTNGWAADMNSLGEVVVNASGEPFLIVPLDENPADGLPDTWFKDEGNPPDGINDLMIELGVMDGLYPGTTIAEAISTTGQIVGWSNVGPDNLPRAFLITPDDSNGALEWFAGNGSGGNALMIDLLGDLNAAVYGGGAVDISDTGYVVGGYIAYEPDRRPAWILAPERDADGLPITWFKDEGDPSDPNDPGSDGINDLITELGTTDPVSLPSSNATGVNSDGWVVGTLMDSIGSPVAWFMVIPEDTDGLNGPDQWFRDNDEDGANDLMFELPYSPDDLNDMGQVLMAGAVWQIDPATGEATLLFELEEPPNNLGNGIPRGLNNLGGVVGSAFKQKGPYSWSGDHTPLLWQDGVMYNLFGLMTNDDGIESAVATSIDVEGRILVNGLPSPRIAVPIPPAP